MRRTALIVVIALVAIGAAIGALVTIRDRDAKEKSWASFCNESYLIAQENRTREPDGTRAAYEQSLAQVERLAARSPSDEVADDLRTAAPVLARPFSTEPLRLTSPLLAATTRADTALVEYCRVGRSLFDPGNIQNRPAAN